MIKNFIFTCLFISLSCSAQDYNWNFNRLSISEGLSNTMAYAVMQDSKGFIWVATANGLNRFNAYEIQVFHHDPDDPNSLSANGINDVYEDSNGTIWVGTNKGLNKYNKQTGKFKRYEQDTTMINPAPANVQVIVEDLNGNLWLGTNSENAIGFNPSTEEFSWEVNKIGGRDPRLIRDMIVDHENNLWIGFNGFGITKYDIDKKERKFYHMTQGDQYSNDLSYAFSLYEDKAHNIWLGTFIGGLALYEPHEDNFRFMPNPYYQDNLTKTGVQAIGEDMYGNIVVGGNGGGVFLFDPKTEKFIYNYVFNAINEESISDDFIIDIYTDNTGIIWFGTENGGVFYHNPLENKFKSYKKEGTSSSDMPGVIINSIRATSTQRIWIGTENSGYAILDRTTGKYEQFRLPSVHRDKGNTFINAIEHDGNGGVWIGAEMGGLAHVDSTGGLIGHFGAVDGRSVENIIPSHDILCIMLDSDEQLWVGCYRSFFKFDGKTSTQFCATKDDTLCLQAVIALHDFSEDWLVACYANEGIKFFNKKTESFGSEFKPVDGDPTSLPNPWAHCAYKDSKNRFWVGTLKGLSLMDNKDSTFRTYTTKDGLCDNEVVGILEDHEGQLWIGTSFGLSRFDPETEVFENYYEEDGLRSNVFKRGATYKSQTGEMFFGGPNGFNSFYPYDLEKNPYPPNVVFTDFKIFNKSVMPGENSPLNSLIEETTEIELDYTQDVFSFEFAALNFTVAEKNEYAYMLEGFDYDWNYIGKRRYVSFTSIPAGTYTLKVKASNNDGVWNESGTAIKITIHPPFWETWWFRSLVVFFIALVIYIIYKRRVQAIEKQNKILERQVQERTKQVVEQKDEIEKQKELVEEKNQDMMDSIRYSKRIQDSFLPDIEEFKTYFQNAFVLFKPKDIVSGDFYWAEALHDKIYMAVADCTGHGVPGAMVSVLGNNGLHRSIKDNQHQKPGIILDDLTDYVVQSLEKKGEVVRDGMDICLCAIDPKNGSLEYAGANNPLWICRKGEILEFKADKQPIGKYAKREPFTTQTVQLEKGDWIFMFSDGFPDQFGGPKGKKYKYKTLKDTLVAFENSKESDFEAYLDKEFANWKGDLDQIDDVCILGVKY